VPKQGGSGPHYYERFSAYLPRSFGTIKGTGKIQREMWKVLKIGEKRSVEGGGGGGEGGERGSVSFHKSNQKRIVGPTQVGESIRKGPL